MNIAPMYSTLNSLPLPHMEILIIMGKGTEI
jgi:hypothetical protein